MTTPMRNRMRRHTRPADYVSKSCQADAMGSARPGGRSFSFSGEFPDLENLHPVEAASSRRNYTSGHHTGGYHAIRQDDARRMPAINKHGVHLVPALAIFAVMILFLGSFMLVQLAQRNDVQRAINARQDRINVLGMECANTSRAIAAQSNDVNIRQEAVRMGLISSKGVAVMYLEAPADAVITLPENTAISSLASIWGQ